MKTFSAFIIEDIDKVAESEIQKYGQRLFDKCKTREIHFRLGSHSVNRFDDTRNEAPVTKASIIRILKKGVPKIVKDIELYIDKKICLSDEKTNLHLPMTIQEDSGGIIHINTNSAQNKKDYWYPKGQIPIYVS